MKIPWFPLVLPLALLGAMLSGPTRVTAQTEDGAEVAKSGGESPEAVTREEIRASIQKYFGGPGPEQAIASKPEVLKKIDAGDHERWHLRYLVDHEEFGYAYLLLPKPIPTADHPAPLVVALHPTSDLGKDRVVAIYDQPATSAADEESRLARQYALDLVRRGFLVFAPDRAAYGERRLLPEGKYAEQMKAYSQYLSDRHPGFRLTAGKNVWDLQRGLDMIANFDFVDMDRIGAIGHSLGAWDSLMFIAMDDRVKAAVVNSGGTLKYRPELWRDPAALRAFLNDPKQQSLNTLVNPMLMLAAPRPVLYIWSVQDPYDKSNPNIVEALRDITQYYQQISGKKSGRAKADFSLILHPYGHNFPPEAHEFAYRWLEIRLDLTNTKYTR